MVSVKSKLPTPSLSNFVRVAHSRKSPHLTHTSHLSLDSEDEIHHKLEARENARGGPFSINPTVDKVWSELVFTGSDLAAAAAKRL